MPGDRDFNVSEVNEEGFEKETKSKEKMDRYNSQMEREKLKTEKAEKKAAVAKEKLNRPSIFDRSAFLSKIRDFARKIKDAIVTTAEAIGVTLLGGRKAFQTWTDALNAEKELQLINGTKSPYSVGSQVIVYDDASKQYLEGTIKSAVTDERGNFFNVALPDGREIQTDVDSVISLASFKEMNKNRETQMESDGIEQEQQEDEKKDEVKGEEAIDEIETAEQQDASVEEKQEITEESITAEEEIKEDNLFSASEEESMNNFEDYKEPINIAQNATTLNPGDHVIYKRGNTYHEGEVTDVGKKRITLTSVTNGKETVFKNNEREGQLFGIDELTNCSDRELKLMFGKNTVTNDFEETLRGIKEEKEKSKNYIIYDPNEDVLFVDDEFDELASFSEPKAEEFASLDDQIASIQEDNEEFEDYMNGNGKDEIDLDEI